MGVYVNRTKEEVNQVAHGHRFHMGNYKRAGAPCGSHPQALLFIFVGSSKCPVWTLELGSPSFRSCLYPLGRSYPAFLFFLITMTINTCLKALWEGLARIA